MRFFGGFFRMFIPLFSKRRYDDICDSKRLSDRGILVAFADEIDSTSAEARRWAESGETGGLFQKGDGAPESA